jgi:hypothetical protein
MRRLLAYYEEKQGRVVERNQFTAGMFQEQVDRCLEATHNIAVQPYGSKRGYAVYSEQQEADWFREMKLGDFKRVFFFREQPDLQAAGLGAYEPFDPTPKKEVVQPNEPRPGHSNQTHRRRFERRKQVAWVMATVVGLSLLVVGGGIWWVLDSESTKAFPVQTPTSPDTPVDRAKAILEPRDTEGGDSLKSQSAVADQSKKKETDSSAKPELDSMKDGTQPSIVQQQEPTGSTSTECKKWCDNERQKANMPTERLEAHNEARPADCTCPTK